MIGSKSTDLTWTDLTLAGLTWAGLTWAGLTLTPAIEKRLVQSMAAFVEDVNSATCRCSRRNDDASIVTEEAGPAVAGADGGLLVAVKAVIFAVVAGPVAAAWVSVAVRVVEMVEEMAARPAAMSAVSQVVELAARQAEANGVTAASYTELGPLYMKSKPRGRNSRSVLPWETC